MSAGSQPAVHRSSAIEERERALRDFIDREARRLTEACFEMARHFSRGGTLVAYGTGAASSDAAHAVVEFMHPVIVGKRALPALAPSNDPAQLTATRIIRPDDIVLGLEHGARDPVVTEALAQARELGCLTVGMSGAGGRLDADHSFSVPSDDPMVVQEVQETSYHVLWELVHVFFEHPGLLEDACITCGDVAVEATVVSVRDQMATIEKDGARERVATELVGELTPGDRVLAHAGVALEKLGNGHDAPDPDSGTESATSFLYPFLDSSEDDLEAVLADVEESTRQKAADVIELRQQIDVGRVAGCREDVAERLRQGGRLFAFGNGGSATDAQDAAADLLAQGWPAICLSNDSATVTAVANDVGYANVFSRQLISLAGPRDVALAISTSGDSENVIAALEEAHRRRLLTIAVVGYDGGRLARVDWLDHLLVVASDYIPRIQEAQATIYHLLVGELGRR